MVTDYLLCIVILMAIIEIGDWVFRLDGGWEELDG